MKLAIVSHSLSGGGAERVASVLANGLVERGHSVSIFVQNSNSDKENLHPSIKLTVLKSRSRAARIRNLGKCMRCERYDVVHTITPLLTLEALIARAYARQSETKIVGSYHGFGRFSRIYGSLGALSYHLTPVITRAADKNICVSDAIRADLIDQWGAKPDNLVRIYNPVLIPGLPVVFLQGESNKTTNLPSEYILYVGRLIQPKNPVLALKALALLPERFANLSLIMLGDGPLRNELERHAHRLNIAHRVIFENHVNDPGRYYRNAKVLISTSDGESFGLVIVEAMAYGLPVVSTSSGGPQEILAGGRFGLLVPIGDEISFAAAIACAIDNPPSSEMLKRRASEFGVELAVKAYEDLFSSISVRR